MDEKSLRDHVLYLLGSGGAHIGFERAIGEFPADLAGEKVPNLDHTAWDLVYHMWICQWDILEFSINPDHISPDYPSGYWPSTPPTAEEWEAKTEAFVKDLKSMKKLVEDESNDLFTPFPHGTGQTLLREALLVADHNSYHIGQLVDIRMLLGVPVRDW